MSLSDFSINLGFKINNITNLFTTEVVCLFNCCIGAFKVFLFLTLMRLSISFNVKSSKTDILFLNKKANLEEAISSIMGSTSLRNLTRASWLVKSLFCVKY